MKKSQNISEQQYLDEIRTWQEASKIHAQSAIEQYKKVTETLEAIHFEKVRNAEILKQLNDGVIVVDQDFKIVIWNDACTKLFHFDKSQVEGQDFGILFGDVSPEIVQLVEQMLSGTQKVAQHQITFDHKFIECKLRKVLILKQNYVLILMEDVTELLSLQHSLEAERSSLQQRVEERTAQLKQMALRDTLTGLPNRLAFEEHLKQLLAEQAKSASVQYSVLFIDLDGFKLINDTMGHDAGDALLIQAAERFKKHLRATDFIARLGGDEFVAVLNGTAAPKVVESIAQKIIQAFEEPIILGSDQVAHISCSIGICTSDILEEATPSKVLTLSDHAMYEAKKQGKNRFVFFEPEMLEDMSDDVRLANAVVEAVHHNQFIPYFQPLCTVNGEVVGAEVLARWRYQGQMVPPFRFIPIIEKKGLIAKFTFGLIEQVFTHLTEYPHIPCVSINLSLQQFYDEQFIPDLEALMKAYPNAYGRVNFEITESAFNAQKNMVSEKLSLLRKMGFKVYIDDFGTGYSAFSYIKSFESDVIKIDREFVRNISTEMKDQQLLEGMISLIQTLNMQVVVEGVETQQELEAIANMSQEVLIQGFYFYKPLPLDEFVGVLSQDT